MSRIVEVKDHAEMREVSPESYKPDEKRERHPKQKDCSMHATSEQKISQSLGHPKNSGFLEDVQSKNKLREP